jgi:aryl-alcohol dehydrogenase
MAQQIGSPATDIIAVDLVDSRLATARELGATITINAREVKDVPEKIKELTGGGVDYSVECSGSAIGTSGYRFSSSIA